MAKSKSPDGPMVGENVIFYPDGKFKHDKFQIATVFGGMNGLLILSVRSSNDGHIVPALKHSIHHVDSDFLKVNQQSRGTGAWDTLEGHHERTKEWRTQVNANAEKAQAEAHRRHQENQQALRDKRERQEALQMFNVNKMSTEEIAAKLGRDLAWVQTAIETTPRMRPSM